MASYPSLQPEIGSDGLAREAPVIAYTEKVIEEEQLQLRKYIEENYSKIRDVERELTNLTLEMKLTAGPKKAALEHLRKKIEMSTERIRLAKQKEEQAKQAWEAALKVVKDEEAMKQKLCEDLSQLVQESSNSQFSRLEELKRRLEALNPSRASTSSGHDGKAVAPAKISTAPDASSVPAAAEPVVGVTQNASSNQGNGGNAPDMNGHNQQPTVEGDVRAKKKTQFHGRGKGVGAIPKGRGSTAPGWTGAGFDVDGRDTDINMAQNNTPPQQQQQLSPPIKKKNSKCRRCLIAVVAALILVLVICIIILILLLTVLKPKQPRTQIQLAKVDGFTSRLTFPKIEFKLNITLELQILVQNENHASFKHGNGKSSLFYKGNQVGDVDIDPGLIPARGSTTVSSRLTLEVDKLADDLTDLIRDVLGGTLVMETRTEIPGRVNFLGIFKKHIKATSECIFTIGFPDMKIQSQECNNKASL